MMTAHSVQAISSIMNRYISIDLTRRDHPRDPQTEDLSGADSGYSK